MELEHRIYDCILGITTLIGTIGLATFTIIRCRNRWEFMLIGVWKIFMSAMLSFTSITTAVEPQSRRSVYWSFLYFPGLVTGFVGLCSLVNQDWKEKTVQIISFAFAGTLVLVSVVGVIFLQCLGSDSRTLKRLAKSPLAAGIILFVTGTSVLGALYSDWILGAIGDDLVGFPSGDNQYLYWAYFVAKRLPLLSF
jgi:hypothetical protein